MFSVGVIEAVLRMKDEFSAGIRQAQESFSGLRGAVAAVGVAFTTLSLGAAAGDAIKAASDIADAADRIGISAESVQRLGFAAEQGGSSLNAVATAIGTMASKLDEKGTGELIRSLGLDLEQLKGMQPDQAFIAIADAVGKIPEPLRQADAMREIFGRGALELMPAVKAGFKEVGDAAPIMSEKVVKSGDEIGDAWAAMQKQVGTLKAQALVPLLGLFTSMPDSIQVAVGGIATLMPNLQGIATLVLAAGGPTAALTGLATLFTVTLPAAFGAVLPFLGPVGIIALAVGAVVLAWKHWDSIVAFVQGVYTAVKTWIVDKLVPILVLGGPLLGPVGLVVATWKHWDKITEIAKAVYDGVRTWLVEKFSAIVEAVKGKIDAVTGFFSNMYTAVVGQSFVPDMITRIAEEFGKLQGVMVEPARLAAASVTSIFSGMFSGAIQAFQSNGVSGLKDFAVSQGKQIATDFVATALSFIPGIGPALSQLARPIVEGATKLFGSLFNRNKGRDLVEDFAAGFGGFDNLHRELHKLGDAVGEELWIKLTQGVGRNNPDQARRVIEEVRLALEKLGSTKVVVPIKFNVDDLPAIASRERRGTLEYESARSVTERTAPAAATSDRARHITVVAPVYLDRRQIAEAMAAEVLA